MSENDVTEGTKLHFFDGGFQAGGAMSNLMQLAEVLRDIAEEHNMSEIEQALDLCTGFADRVGKEREGAVEDPESLRQSITTKDFCLPN
jgi:hypothetical protein